MNLDPLLYKFEKVSLDAGDKKALFRASMKIRSDILELLAAAGSGHIGGSYSTLDALLLAYVCGNIFPENANAPGRDRIIVSHGHISAALYTVLAAFGFLDREELFREYRRIPGRYEGHPSIRANGVEWGNGSLGQGLSVGCGMALADRLQGNGGHVFVFMGDGENGKGQITEAMALAGKYRLGSLTAFVDDNGLQCTGAVSQVMPMDLPARYAAYGWRVFVVDGHDFQALYEAFREAYKSEGRPCVIIGKTVMGKGLPFIENDRAYHGSLPGREQLARAREVFSDYTEADMPVIRKRGILAEPLKAQQDTPSLETPDFSGNPGDGRKPGLYHKPVAYRNAVGEALRLMGEAKPCGLRPVVVDCDVSASTGVSSYMEAYPERGIQCGIAEENAMSVAGGLSVSGETVFFSTFGVFAFGEPYGQLRTNHMNYAPVKILATHCGLDVGPDGKTHQCTDYIGLCAGLYGFKLIIPGDGNQTMHAMSYLADSSGAGALAVGRSVVPVITKEDKSLYFGPEYVFRYGEADWIRRGRDAVIISYGTLLHVALEAVGRLKEKGISCGLLNVSCPLSLDMKRIKEAAQTGLVVAFEDHNVETGAGTRIGASLIREGIFCRFIQMGIRRYGGSADAWQLYRQQGLDADTLVRVVTEGKRGENDESDGN